MPVSGLSGSRRPFAWGRMEWVMAGNDTEGLRYGAIETPEKYYLKWVEETDDFASEPNCGFASAL